MRVARLLVAVVAVLLAIAGGGLALRAAAGPPPAAQAQAAASPAPAAPAAAVTVVGQGTATSAPDVAYATLGVQTQAGAVQDAADANSTAMAAVIAAIKAQGVAERDLQTNGFSIQPVYNQPSSPGGGAPSISGYRVSNAVSVTIHDLSSVSKLLDAAVKAGANSSVGLRFGVQDTTALQQQALTAAMQQASAKADAIAKAAGMKLTGAYAVEEQSAGAPVPVAQGAAQAAAAYVAPQVEEGQLRVQATVRVAFGYTR